MEDSRARELLAGERRRIEEELTRLRGELGAPQGEWSGDVAGDDQHFADQGTDTQMREDDVSRIDRLEEELDAVARAEERLRAGRYGLSVRSGRPIPDARLEAVPTAELTIEEAEDRLA